MITQFQRVIHRHGRIIFMVLLGIIVVAFLAWDYSGYFGSVGRAETAKKLYGKSISPRDVDAAKRRQSLMRNARAADEAALERETLEQMALIAKARSLGISATEDEVGVELRKNITYIRQAAFKNAESDAAAYQQFRTEILSPRKLNDDDFYQLLEEGIILKKLVELVSSTVKVTPAEASSFASEFSEKISAQAVRFELNDYMKAVKPTEDDFKKFHEFHPDQFRTPNRVNVDYVAFPVDASKVTVTDQDVEKTYQENKEYFKTPDGKTQTLKEVAPLLKKNLAQQKASGEAMNRATEFTVKLVPEAGKTPLTFEQAATELGLKVKQTGFFSENEPVKEIGSPAFTSAAFKLNDEIPVSDPVQSREAVYVLYRRGVQPGRDLKYEEAREAVKTACIASKALELARETGAKKREAVLASIKQGKSVEKALAEAGVKAQVLKPFSLSDNPDEDVFANEARRTASQLPPNGVSAFTENIAGGFFVAVTKREAGKADDVKKLQARIEQQLTEIHKGQLLEDFQKATLEEALGKKPADKPTVQ
jgi:hypothetical protein